MHNLLKFTLTLITFCCFAATATAAERFITTQKCDATLLLKDKTTSLTLFSNNNIDPGVQRAIVNLQTDFLRVTGTAPKLTNAAPDANTPLIIIGTIGTNSVIDDLVKQKKINATDLKGKREKFIIQNMANPLPGIAEALVIAGSDKRGTIYGIYELSQQIGVSPWYYWADVPVEQKDALYFTKGTYTDGEPAVEYRGIFLNDEAPALSGWSRKTFGGFNSKFYEQVFELLLRLKANFMWPAMWGSAFYDDDPANGPLANEMGIIMGTSHHEPMAMAQSDWHRRGGKNNEWNYITHSDKLKAFWKAGIERSNDWERVVTVGMRGDGDEAMSEDTNIGLLEKIVKDQRQIIQQVTGKKPNQTPQVWALYKEVQDYYDHGMRVPDDVTLLFCDDNWGNVRKLRDLTQKAHPGGYGMYYHFDYVGGPRCSKWININPIQRVWEQMNLAYEHGVSRLWVVNVGDLKPMEYPISFFLDMAWNPSQFNAQNLMAHTREWAGQQFGEQHASEIACMINRYTKYNRRVIPELLSDKTYSLENYNEFETVLNEYRTLSLEAWRLYNQLPANYRDAYFQLVLYPIDACCNLYEMYYAVAKNKQWAAKKDIRANIYADKVKKHFERNAFLANEYNNVMANGKWVHMMDEVTIGYRSWNGPKENIMPDVTYITDAEAAKEKVFLEKDGYISIEACHYARRQDSDRIHWEEIPHFGKTRSGITTFPQNATPNDSEEVYVEYDVEFTSTGQVEVQLLLAPTLNYNENKGLRYSLSFDNDTPQTVNFNGHYRGELGKWQAEHIIRSSTKHTISQPGKHTLRFRVHEPGIVLEKILIDTGGLKPSYLGAPESEYK
ncbi:glycosyl hydrolase 115 family protein [Bacteroides sp. 51]|uniref:glycosyl hydrolase 115 family protein n=1 Tax=Bacteroides sp. 51 TaxID=2302938 RepID=UPI0013D37B51|nr:glycosyl hydrolase 115 family protein [Bacteroides sp. 51]NDV81567.1 glycosyhydrolase [Bacteroides sp. 51]